MVPQGLYLALHSCNDLSAALASPGPFPAFQHETMKTGNGRGDELSYYYGGYILLLMYSW